MHPGKSSDWQFCLEWQQVQVWRKLVEIETDQLVAPKPDLIQSYRKGPRATWWTLEMLLGLGQRQKVMVKQRFSKSPYYKENVAPKRQCLSRKQGHKCKNLKSVLMEHHYL